jgi:hypothetical protein
MLYHNAHHSGTICSGCAIVTRFKMSLNCAFQWSIKVTNLHIILKTFSST